MAPSIILSSLEPELRSFLRSWWVAVHYTLHVYMPISVRKHVVVGMKLTTLLTGQTNRRSSSLLVGVRGRLHNHILRGRSVEHIRGQHVKSTFRWLPLEDPGGIFRLTRSTIGHIRTWDRPKEGVNGSQIAPIGNEAGS